jgi:cation diffusion facilitator CzcD-associated flavoprotein CzcO
MDTGYLTSLHSPKAHLITSPRISLTPTSLVTTTGSEIPIDILILATGFVTNRFLAPMCVVGRGGETLEQHFETLGGPGAYNTAAVNGFPNFFMILGPNAATGHTSALMASEK